MANSFKLFPDIKLLLSFCLLQLTVPVGYAQPSEPHFNWGFEKQDPRSGIGEGWIEWGDYMLATDSQIVNSGRFAAKITSDENGSSYGSIAYKIPAHYKGSTIRLNGFMKLENVEMGFAGLLLRIDGDGGSLAFDNMHEKNISGSRDWQEYQITLAFPENAQDIYIGGILSGKGTAWFDDFQVLIDDKELQFAEKQEKPVAGATLDDEFDTSSRFYKRQVTDSEIDRLYKLGKIWGFLKYYHPAVASGDINWDYELFRVLPAIQSDEFDQVLAQWVHSLDTIHKSSYPTPATPKAVKSQPNLDWISDTTLVSNSISSMLLSLKDSVSIKSHYYVSTKPNVGNPIFTNENPYPAMDWDDTGYKVLALFRYWNMIEYFFPYKHLIEKDWDQVLKEYVPKMISSKGELGYKLVLLQLIGEVRDTHANIWQLDSALEGFFGNRAAPVQVGFVENRPVVLNIEDQFLSESNIEIGDVITAVNGVDISQLMEEKLKYCPASNYPTQLRDVSKKLLRTNDSIIKISLQNEAGKKEERVPTVPYSKLRYRSSEKTSHEALPGNIGYIYPGSLEKAEIDSIMKGFMDKKGIIIDFRCYPSDFIVFSMSKYLMPKPTEFVKFSMPSLAFPGLYTWRGPLSVGDTNEHYYKGKLVILINEKTQSSAEYHCMAFRMAPDATIIGSTTAGADGNVSEIMLPGNVRTMISGIGVYYPDGRETQRIGIIPDIEARPSIAGVRRGEDEVLQKAIELINHRSK